MPGVVDTLNFFLHASTRFLRAPALLLWRARVATAFFYCSKSLHFGLFKAMPNHFLRDVSSNVSLGWNQFLPEPSCVVRGGGFYFLFSEERETASLRLDPQSADHFYYYYYLFVMAHA